MNISIRSVASKDFDQARKFAVHGMNLNWYAKTKLELYIYSKYFWYLELCKATRVLGAYQGDKLLGVLMVSMNNQPRVYSSWVAKTFIRLTDVLINVFYGRSANSYNAANASLLRQLPLKSKADGELNFFAVDPCTKGQGVGTLLLNELEKLEAGMFIYLFTDSGSTYQFYERRGFVTIACKDIVIDVRGDQVPLSCFLFGKRLGKRI